MKLTDFALVFLGILLPVVLVIYVNVSYTIKATEQEVYYQSLIDSAIKDASIRMKQVENEGFYRLADALIKEEQKDKAEKVLDRIVELTPNEKLPYDYFMLPIAESYYKLNKTEKANAIITELADIYRDNLTYYLSLEGSYAGSVAYETKVGMSVMQEIVKLTEDYKQDKLYEKLTSEFDILLQKYMGSQQSK